MGRPAIYSDELAHQICQLVALGSNLDRICAAEGTPDKATVYKWLRESVSFFNDYARARELRADSRSDRIDGYIQSLVAGELDAQAVRVIIDAEKWQAAHEQPKRYGDATLLKHADPEGNALNINVQVTRIEGKKE